MVHYHHIKLFLSDAKNGRSITDNGDSRPNGTETPKDHSYLVRSMTILNRAIEQSTYSVQPRPEDLVLWKSPVQTSVFFVYELIHLTLRGISWLVFPVSLTQFIDTLILQAKKLYQKRIINHFYRHCNLLFARCRRCPSRG